MAEMGAATEWCPTTAPVLALATPLCSDLPARRGASSTHSYGCSRERWAGRDLGEEPGGEG